MLAIPAGPYGSPSLCLVVNILAIGRHTDHLDDWLASPMQYHYPRVLSKQGQHLPMQASTYELHDMPH